MLGVLGLVGRNRLSLWTRLDGLSRKVGLDLVLLDLLQRESLCQLFLVFGLEFLLMTEKALDLLLEHVDDFEHFDPVLLLGLVRVEVARCHEVVQELLEVQDQLVSLNLDEVV